jgi:hypothetical protein
MSANVVVGRTARSDQACDVVLEVHAQHQHRAIAFRREGSKLKWIGEQVVVYGPRKHTTVDGTFDEHITLSYNTSRVYNPRLNRLNVSYDGPDGPLSTTFDDLSLAQVQPLLDQWLQRP